MHNDNNELNYSIKDVLKNTGVIFFLTLCLLGKRNQEKGCFQVENWHIKMETSLEHFQRIVQSIDNLEQETPVHQTVLADNGIQIALNNHWNSPIESKTQKMWINMTYRILLVK